MKEIIKHLTAVVAVFALIIAGSATLNYILIDDSASYTRLMMHEFYNQDNIDILCLGASQCYVGIDPFIISGKTGKKVFNASSSSQAPDASFVIIKEAVKHYHVEEVYLEISASMAEWVGEYKNRSSMTGSYLISDYLRPSWSKVMLLWNGSSSSYYINSFWPAKRNWNYLFHPAYIASNIRKKATDVYKNYGYENAQHEMEWYRGNGYVATKAQILNHSYYTTEGNDSVHIEKISDDWKNTILTIIDYCNKNHIKLTLYDSPISYFRLSAEGNYDEYIRFVNELISDKDVRFAEFNLLRNEYLPYKQSNYKDGHHFNMFGAEEFSNFLAEYINGNIPDSAYYGSISEKLKDITPDYYGICYKDDESMNTRTIRLISNIPGHYDYKVEIETVDGKNQLLQNFDVNSEIRIPKKYLLAENDSSAPKIIVTYREHKSTAPGTRIEY